MTMQSESNREAAVQTRRTQGAWYERFPGLVTQLRPGEGRCAMVFFTYAFLLLVCYYILKTIREPLLLVDASPELKSYAYAVIALALLFIVPLYGIVCQRISRERITKCVTIFFIVNLVVFYLMGQAGVDIGFAYYVWVGIFGIMVIAQFWAHAADSFNVSSGQRLFPAIMAAAALGGLIGPSLVGVLFAVLGPWPLMLCAVGLLSATLPLIALSRDMVPESSRGASDDSNDGHDSEVARRSLIGGFGLVFRDRYLLLLAALVVLLNCVNTTGEYLLTEFVVGFASAQVERDPTVDVGAIIAGFYGGYYTTINLLTLTTQLLLVSRLFRWIGVHGSLLILPLIALIGYGLIIFVPVFTVLRVVKIIENSTDYSIMNTSRQALYLPLSSAEKYQAKITIDTFFYRFGDLLQAGIIFAGLNYFEFSLHHFALLNALLAVIWFVVAFKLAKRYAALTSAGARNKHRVRATATRPRPQQRPPMLPVSLKGSRSPAALVLSIAIGVFALFGSNAAEAQHGGLFSVDQELAMDLYIDLRQFCRNPDRKGCEDVPAEIVYADDSGREHRLKVSVRSRGRFRKETGNCQFPALFVFFNDRTTGTLFDGQSMLPLTTHCRHSQAVYDQYVLKEYLAYKIFNLMTDTSLRVRLARITYHDTSGKHDQVERYGFFTEHFDSLASRRDSTVYFPDQWDLQNGHPTELATHDLFQYLIGNTDWSVIHGHNIVHLQRPDGLATPVPYDFDFSGLVNAAYASPPPSLSIRSVRDRVFRGFCREGVDWTGLSVRMNQIREPVAHLTNRLFGPDDKVRAEITDYLSDILALSASPVDLEQEIQGSCRRSAQH